MVKQSGGQQAETFFKPLEKANQHDVTEAAATDILAVALSPTNTPVIFRIFVIVSVAGVFDAQITKGGTTVQAKFNSGNNLTAGCAYIFDILVHEGDTINFQHDIIADITLRVQEIVGAVQ